MSSAPETEPTDPDTMEVDTVSAEFGGGPSTQEWAVIPKIDETSIDLLNKPPIERLIDRFITANQFAIYHITNMSPSSTTNDPSFYYGSGSSESSISSIRKWKSCARTR